MADDTQARTARQSAVTGQLQLRIDAGSGPANDADLPADADIERWAAAALERLLALAPVVPLRPLRELAAMNPVRLAPPAATGPCDTLFEISVRLATPDEIQALNRDYRQRDRPTNVLSFPAGLPLLPGEPELLSLGDIVLCPVIIAAEAASLQRTLAAHWAHLVVHGVLHLAGYDHEDDTSAEAMESLEIQILSNLSFDNPYLQTPAE